MAVLEDILAACRSRLAATCSRRPLAEVREAARLRSERRNFAEALRTSELAVIAELKRASPSGGVLRREYACRDLAAAYEAAGASALSVLTEPQYFGGSLGDLVAARQSVRLPVLRKDFIVEHYQLYESVAAGADAVLLIVAALNDRDLRRLIGLAAELGVGALVEVHTAEEVDRALEAGARLIGVNNRDLNTLRVDLETSFRLRARIPSGCVAVSESGIKTGSHLKRLREAGFDAALVGEHLMTSADPGGALRTMLEEARLETRNSKIGASRR